MPRQGPAGRRLLKRRLLINFPKRNKQTTVQSLNARLSQPCDRVAARKERAQAKSPHWWDDELVTGKFEKDDCVARVMDHLDDQYDGPIGSDPPTWGFPGLGDKFDEFQPVARNFAKIIGGNGRPRR